MIYERSEGWRERGREGGGRRVRRREGTLHVGRRREAITALTATLPSRWRPAGPRTRYQVSSFEFGARRRARRADAFKQTVADMKSNLLICTGISHHESQWETGARAPRPQRSHTHTCLRMPSLVTARSVQYSSNQITQGNLSSLPLLPLSSSSCLSHTATHFTCKFPISKFKFISNN